jgi:NADH-quinone oxidoreductase subunit L
MVALTFVGEERFDHEHEHPHESPRSMTTPLVVLAVLAIFGGAFGLPHLLQFRLLDGWLAPVVADGNALLFAAHEGEASHLSTLVEILLLVLGGAVALFFAHRGFHDHKAGPAADEEFARTQPGVQRRLSDAWGIDRAYASFVVQPVKIAAFLIAVVVDQFAIDGLVNGCGALARSLGGKLRHLADGRIATYGLWMGGAAAVLGLVWLWGGTL